jgi:hypothetical protein
VDGLFRLREAADGVPSRIADKVIGDQFAAWCVARILRLSEQTPVAEAR